MTRRPNRFFTYVIVATALLAQSILVSGCIIPEEVIIDIWEDFQHPAPKCQLPEAGKEPFAVPQGVVIGDLNGDGVVSVVDVQCEILVKQWMEKNSDDPLPSCAKALPVSDINCDFVVDIEDVMLRIDLALGKGLPTELDTNGDNIVDACQCQ